jgi:hypothetical protein
MSSARAPISLIPSRPRPTNVETILQGSYIGDGCLGAGLRQPYAMPATACRRAYDHRASRYRHGRTICGTKTIRTDCDEQSGVRVPVLGLFSEVLP